MQVPYAMSAVGKTDVQDRLQLLLDTFVVTKFAPEKMVDEAEHSLSVVHGVYRHKKTGEILDIKLRFRAWIANGLITRLEEIHDARFIEAYGAFRFPYAERRGRIRPYRMTVEPSIRASGRGRPRFT